MRTERSELKGRIGAVLVRGVEIDGKKRTVVSAPYTTGQALLIAERMKGEGHNATAIEITTNGKHVDLFTLNPKKKTHD